MMMPHLPLERTSSYRDESHQLAFARDALDLLTPDETTAFEATSIGLIMLGATEAALERAVETLRQVYRDRLAVTEPTVRYRQSGGVLEEPWMAVRVLCPPEHVRAVRTDLERRGASYVDSEPGPYSSLVRATAPLGMLLGYGRELARLTGGRAQHSMWLKHYAPIEEVPRGERPAGARRFDVGCGDRTVSADGCSSGPPPRRRRRAHTAGA